MSLETMNFLDDFVLTNPAVGDARSEGDDHLRGIKTAIKATFPGMAGRAWRAQTKSAGYTGVATDNMTVLNCTAALTLALTAAATLGNGWMAVIHANGGAVTIDPNGAETVNGAATLLVPDGHMILLFCNGSSFRAAMIPVQNAIWSTGDVKITLKTVADAGWVLMNDGTIGNAASTGTARANADTEALFTLLWNNTTDANCAVSGGRGASAAADYAANKTIALPKVLGRALAAAGAGSGLTSRALAVIAGAEDAVVVSHSHGGVTGGQSADHTHSGTTSSDGAHSHTERGDPADGGAGGNACNIIQTDRVNPTANTSTASTTSTDGAHQHTMITGGASAGHTHTVAAEGVSATGANMQPSVFLNVMVKL